MNASEQVKRLGESIESAMLVIQAAAKSDETRRAFREAIEATDLFGEVCKRILPLFATCIDGLTREQVWAVEYYWQERGYELHVDGFHEGERYAFSFEDALKQMGMDEQEVGF